MTTTTQLASGLGGAIGSHFQQATNQLFFVEFDGKVSVLDLIPQLEAVLFTGNAIVPPDTSLDLADGTSTHGGDIRWDHTSPGGQRVLRPQGNCRLSYLGNVNFNSLDHASLVDLPYSQNSLIGEGPGNQIVVGAVFAVFNAFRQSAADWDYAKVRVLQAGPSIRLQWVTYQTHPRYRVLGTGYNQPEDIVVAADGVHAYVTERVGNLLRIDLTSADRASATVVTAGMVAPHQIALDEPHGLAYVVEFNGATSRLWRVELATGAKTAVVSNLINAIGLLATDDMSVAYVSQQTGGPNSVCRVSLLSGHVDPLPVSLTAPFFMTWAGSGQSGILIAERDPANRVTLLDLTATPIAAVPVTNVPVRPSSVAALSANMVLVCCDQVIVRCDLTGSVFTGVGPMLLGIGHVPKTEISADGYATTDPGYFLRVTDSPFGGTLPVMVNHEKARSLGGQYYRIFVDGVAQDAPWNDYLWNSSLTQFVLTAVPQSGSFFRVHQAGELWYNHWLGYLLNTAALADGPHTIAVRIYGGPTPLLDIPAGADSLTVMVDNQLPRAVINSIIYHDPTNPDPALQHRAVSTCAIVEGTSDEFSFTIEAQDPVAQHLMSWSLSALWGDNRSAGIASDQYAPAHLSPTHQWAGVAGEVPIPHWHATVPGDPTSRRCAHTFRLSVWDRVINGWNYIHYAEYHKSITLLLS